MRKAKTQTKGLSSSMGSLAGAFTGVGAAMAAVAVGTAVLNKAIDLSIAAAKKMAKEFNENEKAVRKLQGVLKSTNEVAGASEYQMRQLADSLSKTTMFSDEMILSAEAMILTFTNIGSEVIPRTTRAILDMAAFMDEDLKASSIRLGKALDRPKEGISALSEVGTTFTQQEREMIAAMVDANDTLGAQNLILGALERQYGGTAEALGDTLVGQVTIATNEFSDLAAELGRAVASIPQLADGMRTLIDAIETITKDTRLHNLELQKQSEAWETMSSSAQLAVEQEILAIKKRDLAMATSPTWAQIWGESWDEALELALGPAGWMGKWNAEFMKMNAEAVIKIMEFAGIDVKQIAKDSGIAVDNYKDLRTALAAYVGIDMSNERTKQLEDEIKATEDRIQALKDLKKEEDDKKTFDDGLQDGFLESMNLSRVKKEEIREIDQSNIEIADKHLEKQKQIGEITFELTKAEKHRAKATALANTNIGGSMADLLETTRGNAEVVAALRIAQAIADTYAAANNALATGVPPFNYMAAAAVTASGLANVNSIRNAYKQEHGQTGFEGMVDEPTQFTVGEGGAAEYVSVTPMEGVNNAGGQAITIHISGNVMSEQFVEEELASKIREAVRQGTDFGMV